MRKKIAFVLAAVFGPLTPSLFAADSASPSARLGFTASASGEFQFDTGVLRGKLRPGGKARGLASVVHIPSGSALDQGDSGYGLFSHYRVFSANKRYGTAAWDWPGTARLVDGGAVEVHWPAGPDRPFAMKVLYRWTGPATLDLVTTVEAQEDLPRFEVFLASYFRKEFTNALVWVTETAPGTGRAGLLAAEKSSGDWQMFPRSSAMLPLINDGRWQLPPNPVAWVIRPALQQPLAVRRAPAGGLTAVLMAPAEDCFAIAMPYQTEGHYSIYLSLFGRNVKAGETARARARLTVGVQLSDEQVLRLYQDYSTSHRQKP